MKDKMKKIFLLPAKNLNNNSYKIQKIKIQEKVQKDPQKKIEKQVAVKESL
jgi:hypothetical protein